MIVFLICIICELAWIFCYGLLLNSFMPMLWVLILSLILAGLSTLLYDAINRASGEYVAEYDVEVESCLYNNGGKAYFKAPNGQDASVRLNDYRLIKQDDDFIIEGDVITVQEYVGLFRKTYFILVDENE